LGEEASRELDQFAKTWDEKYPQILQSLSNLLTFFGYPEDIGNTIYTSSAIEL
jgi:putative transposase